MAAPTMDTVQTDTDLPHRTSVVVIGGGIAGVSTALFLAQKGIPVVVCEKGRVGFPIILYCIEDKFFFFCMVIFFELGLTN